MKKKIATFVILCFLAVGPAAAFFPVGIPALYYGASALVHLGAAAGLYYALKPDAPSSVSGTGDVSRPASVVYVDLTGDTPMVVENNLTAKQTSDQIINIAKSKPTEYPALSNATAGTYNSSSLPVGSTAPTASGLKYQITGGAVTFSDNCFLNPYTHPSYPTFPMFSTGWYYTAPIAIGQGRCPVNNTNVVSYRYPAVATSNPLTPPPPISPSQLAQNLSGSSTGGSALPSVQGELDKAMNDPNYTPTFSDATTGLPWAPPPSEQIATPSQVASYNANGQAVESATTASTSAASAATAAGAAYTASGGDISTGTGGDLSLYRDYLSAKAEADRTQAALDALKAQLTDEDDGNQLTGSTFNGSTAYGDGSTFDFGQRFQQFFGEMQTTAVFSLPNQFLTSIPTGSSSVVSFNGGRFGSHSFDFATFSDLWLALKTVILVLFGWLSIRIAILKGGAS
ncbi:MAG: hypothetical protein AB7U43_05230 [Desulfobacter sp.]